MKKILTLVFILGIFLSIEAQDDKKISPAIQEAENLSAEVVNLFRQKKYQEALPIAHKVVQINENEFGKESVEVAVALRNLGFVYYFLDDKKEAEKTFERASIIFEKQTALQKEENLLLAEMLEKLAFIKYDFRKPESTESLFEKALLAYQKAGEKDTLKAANLLVFLGNLKGAKKDFVQSSDFYEQALAIRVKNSGAKSFEASDAFDRSACSLKKAGKEQDIKRLQETFFPAAKVTEYGNLEWADDKIDKEFLTFKDKTLVGNDNGKALSLPKPAYPVEARQLRASGTVKVWVKTNEQGNVVYACGAFNDINKSLIEAAELAAYGAKFKPTLFNGQPVKVAGVIVYNFIAP